MNRGTAHQRTFFSAADRRGFLSLLGESHDQCSIDVLAYCLMDNHFHLLLRDEAGRISEAMKRVAGIYTQLVNRRLGRDGPLFRGRFHSIPVETDAYLLAAARYIHLNPLDLPSVSSPADYRWSSYGAYLGNRSVPEFLDRSVLSSFLPDARAVRSFTEDSRRRPARLVDPTSGPATLADIRQVVEGALAIADTEVGDDRPDGWRYRMVLVGLLTRLPAGRLRDDLTAHLGFSRPDACTRAIRRAAQLIEADPVTRRAVALVEEYLGHHDVVAA